MNVSACTRLAHCDLVYECAAPDWVLGAPLGNGHVGMMLWGDGSPLSLTLDRDDVWDLRNPHEFDSEYRWDIIQDLIASGDMKKAKEILDRNLGNLGMATPAKLPIGRLEITCAGCDGSLNGRLSLGDAVFRGEMGDIAFEAFVPAEEPLYVVKFAGSQDVSVRMRGLRDLNAEEADRLGLADIQNDSDDSVSWAVQEFPTGARAVIAWKVFRQDGDTVFLGTIVSTCELSCDATDDPVTSAAARLNDAVERFPAICAAHTAWWEQFWSRSRISLLDCRMETLWYFGLYKLASSSRAGHLPANLQGLWVTDGLVPPWSGEYALNMNIQETYWPVYATNHLELAEPFYEWVERITPTVRKRTKEFFRFDGLRIESGIAADSTPLQLWGTVQFWPGAAAWLAHHFWLHWKYSQDKGFLRDRAYPFMKLCAAFWLEFLEEDAEGVLHVPLSHSPEWDSNDITAWGRDTNIDLALVRNLMNWMVEASVSLGVDEDDRVRWQDVLDRLQPYLLDEHDGLMIKEDTPYTASHRHPSHLLAIFPLGDLNVECGEDERRIIDRSLHRLEQNGTGEWTGWSFPFVSLIASRVGRKNMAAYMLNLYADCFIMPNGCHVNGDWKKNGTSMYHYRPYTMEAECATTAAVSEMLLQSWGGKIRLFPSLPDAMTDAEFVGLLTESGVKVDAKRRNGSVVDVTLRGKPGAEVVIAGCGPDMEWDGVTAARYEDDCWILGFGETGTVTGRVPGVEILDMKQHDSRACNPLGLRPVDVQAFLAWEK